MITVLNANGYVLGQFVNNTPEGIPYFEPTMTENIESLVSGFSFSVPLEVEESGWLTGLNQVIAKDKDGDSRLYNIIDTYEEWQETGATIRVEAEDASITDMINIPVLPLSATNFQNAVEKVFHNTGWKYELAPDTAKVDNTSFIIEDVTNLRAAVVQLMETYGLNFKFAVDWNNPNGYTKKVIIYKNRGNNTGKYFTYNRDLQGITREINYADIKTAILPYWIDKDTNKLVTLANWTPIAPTEGFTKNYEDNFIINNQAHHEYDVARSYKIMPWQAPYTDKDLNYRAALEEIVKYSSPTYTYTASVLLLENAYGWDGEDVRLGDTVWMKEKVGKHEIGLEARVIEYTYHEDDPSQDEVVFSNWKEIDVSDDESLEVHVYFAWANSEDGSKDFSIVSAGDRKYMGIYSSTDPIQSTDPTRYRWQLTQGSSGTPGEDGLTSYVHMAYANSADGTKDFSLTDPNREYLGTYTDFIQTPSSDPTKYKWSKVKGENGTPGQDGEDGKSSYLHTAWANVATFPEFVKGARPNVLRRSENLILSSNNSSLYPIYGYFLTDDDGRAFYRAGRTKLELNPTKFSLFNTINVSYNASDPLNLGDLTKPIVGKKVILSGKWRTSKEVKIRMMAKAVVNGTTKAIPRDNEEVTLTPEWQTFSTVIPSIEEGTTVLRFLPSSDPNNWETAEGVQLDQKDIKIEIVEEGASEEPTPWIPPITRKLFNPENMYTDGNKRFPSVFQGSVREVTEGVEVAEWGAKDAVTVKFTGGTGLVKGVLALKPNETNTSDGNTFYKTNMHLRNNHEVNTMRLTINGGIELSIPPKTIAYFASPATQHTKGSGIQWNFAVADATMDMDFTMWNPEWYAYDIDHAFTEDQPDFSRLYLGTYTDDKPEASGDPADYEWNLVKGSDGKDGIAGKDGVGLKSTVISYAGSTSGTIPPASGWQEQVPTVPGGQFLWTRTVWTYTDNTSETGYSSAKMGQDGAKGDDGIAGKDGVGIADTLIEYAVNTSGTAKPTSGWSTTIPTTPQGQYLWTRTTWTYTDDTTEVGYTVARQGNNGQNGADGKPAALLTLNASSNTMKFDSHGAIVPGQSISFTAVKQAIPDTVVWKATPYVGTTAQPDITLGGSGDSGRILAASQWKAEYTSVVVTISTANYSSSVTVYKLQDGANGSNGSAALSMLLTNEAVTLPATETGAVTDFSPASGTAELYLGVTKLTSGVTFSVNAVSGAAATIDAATGKYSLASLDPNKDVATVQFKAVYQNTAMLKTMTISKSKQGKQGERGIQGVMGTAIYSPEEPTGSNVTEGATWFKTTSATDLTVISINTFKNGSWVETPMGEQVLSVESLSAISANLGNITAGTIDGIKIQGGQIVQQWDSSQGDTIQAQGATQLIDGALVQDNVLYKKNGEVVTDQKTSEQHSVLSLGSLQNTAISYNADGTIESNSRGVLTGGQLVLTLTEGANTFSGKMDAKALHNTGWKDLRLGTNFEIKESNKPQYKVIWQLDGSRLVKFRGQFGYKSGNMLKGRSIYPFQSGDGGSASGESYFPIELNPDITAFGYGATSTGVGGRVAVTRTPRFIFIPGEDCTYCSLEPFQYIIE